jgi:hypothetical protein
VPEDHANPREMSALERQAAEEALELALARLLVSSERAEAHADAGRPQTENEKEAPRLHPAAPCAEELRR